MTATKQQVTAAIMAIKALADAIRDLGSVPSGHLYMSVMGSMDLQTYTSFIDRLKGADLVAEKNYVLYWVGPKMLGESICPSHDYQGYLRDDAAEGTPCTCS